MSSQSKGSLREAATESWTRLRLNPSMPLVRREIEWEAVYAYLWPRLVAAHAKSFGFDRAEDGAQQALLKLLREDAAKFPDIEHVCGWAVRVSNNFIIDVLRNNARHLSLDRFDASHLADESVRIEVSVMLAREVEEIEKLAGGGLLSERERWLLRLMQEERSVDEIATSIGLTRTACYVAIHRLRLLLRVLTGHSEEETL